MLLLWKQVQSCVVAMETGDELLVLLLWKQVTRAMLVLLLWKQVTSSYGYKSLHFM